MEEFRRKEEAQEIEERDNLDQTPQRSPIHGQEETAPNCCGEEKGKSPPKLLEEINDEDLIQNLEQLSEEGEKKNVRWNGQALFFCGDQMREKERKRERERENG
jgi:hypothetical protein